MHRRTAPFLLRRRVGDGNCPPGEFSRLLLTEPLALLLLEEIRLLRLSCDEGWAPVLAIKPSSHSVFVGSLL